MRTSNIERFSKTTDRLLSCGSPAKPSSSSALVSSPKSSSSRGEDGNDEDGRLLQASIRAVISFTRLCLRMTLATATTFNRHGASPLHLAIVRGMSNSWLRRLLWANRMAVAIQDKGGYLTPLHVALRYDRTSIETVQLLVSPYPPCLSISSKNGYLPLHVAARFSSSVEVICYLLSAYPPGISARARNLDTPLHIAARSDNARSDEIVLTLVDRGASEATSRNRIGETPFSIACGIWEAFVSSPFGQVQIQHVRCESDMVGLLKRLWNKMRFLAKARYYAFNNLVLSHATLVSNNSLLHAALGTSCPMSFIDLVLNLHFFQVDESDRTGRVPLAIAAATVFRGNIEDRCIIDKILARNPGAASIEDNCGNYPLHLAINSGKTWDYGVKSIFDAFPHAINKESVLGLPAFIGAAAARRDRGQASSTRHENSNASKQCFDPRRGKIVPRNNSFDEYVHVSSIRGMFLRNPALKCWDDEIDSEASNGSVYSDASTEASSPKVPPESPEGRDDCTLDAIDTTYKLVRLSPSALRRRKLSLGERDDAATTNYVG